MPPEVEMRAADVSDVSQAIAASSGATVIYQALNPPYHRWSELFPPLQIGALAAAKKTQARYVSIENLYMYDPSGTMTEESRIAPRSKKGALRARMSEEVFELHAKGDIRAAALRSSDYYGPGVLGSSLGERVFENLVKGRTVQVSGSTSLLHSYAYIEDVGRAASVLGTRDEALGGIWIAPHSPAVTQGEMVMRAARVVGANPRVSVLSPMMMRLAGLFVAPARANVEMMYEFTEPFVVDSGKIQHAFGLEPTSIDVGLERTMRWYQAHVRIAE